MRTQIALLGCLMGLLFSTSAGNSNAPARIVVVMPTRVPSGLSAAEAAPRAHDPESSPNPSSAVTAPDSAVTVRVQDEAGLARPGARVYHNGEYVGRTGHAGTMRVRDVTVGDQGTADLADDAGLDVHPVELEHVVRVVVGAVDNALALRPDVEAYSDVSVDPQRRADLGDGSGLEVGAEELARRREHWTPPSLKATRGTLYKYIKAVKSASEGCVTDE